MLYPLVYMYITRRPPYPPPIFLDAPQQMEICFPRLGVCVCRPPSSPNFFVPQAVVRVMSPVVLNLVPFLSPHKRLHLFSCVARTPFSKYTEQTLHLVSGRGNRNLATSLEIFTRAACFFCFVVDLCGRLTPGFLSGLPLFLRMTVTPSCEGVPFYGQSLGGAQDNKVVAGQQARGGFSGGPSCFRRRIFSGGGVYRARKAVRGGTQGG